MNIAAAQSKFVWIEEAIELLGYRRATVAELAKITKPCPVVPGCTFIGVYFDEDEDCWCVYYCTEPKGIRFEACP